MNYPQIIAEWIIPLGIPTILGTIAGAGVTGFLENGRQKAASIAQVRIEVLKEDRQAKRNAIAALHERVWDIYIALLEAGLVFKEYLEAGSDPAAIVHFNASGKWPENVQTLGAKVAESQKDVASKLMYLETQIAIVGITPLSEKSKHIRQVALKYMSLHPSKKDEIKEIMDEIAKEYDSFSGLVTDALDDLVAKSTTALAPPSKRSRWFRSGPSNVGASHPPS